MSLLSARNNAKLKTNLQLAIQRLKLLAKKKAELAFKSRKEIADYLQQGKRERAQIHVEHIIREDYYVEAMEIVEMYCDTILARFGMVEQLRTLENGLAEAVSSILWAAPRMQANVKELGVIAQLLTAKYGKRYCEIVQNQPELTASVNDSLRLKLSVQSPPKILVERYLSEIAKTIAHQPDTATLPNRDKASACSPVKLPPSTGPLIDLMSSEGQSQPPSFGSNLKTLQNTPVGSPTAVQPINLSSSSGSSSKSNTATPTNVPDFDESFLPSVPKFTEEDSDSIPGQDDDEDDITAQFNDFQRRFNALKKRKN